VPTGRAEVVNEATPFVRFPVPITAPRCSKLTVPLGTLPNVAFTVAVKVTVWPNTDGFGVEVNMVVVGALLTVCATAAEVLAISVTLPEYTAMM
jgi:hypothetical protein